jgi:hypothetical protein
VRNTILRQHTASDIDAQIAKVLRGLGNPEPPLRVEDVRELLKLDTKFYSSTDTGLLQETISRMQVGAKQVLARPALLVDALRKFQLKALWVPDRRRILIDKEVPLIKHRWVEAHEVTHSVLPWHQQALLGDTEHTLALHAQEQLEAEANYGAGRLLFLGDKFKAECRDLPPGFKAVASMAKRYRNTLASTLWRYVENVGETAPIVGLVSVHPSTPVPQGAPLIRYFIRSAAFAARFPKIEEAEIFQFVRIYCGTRQRGPLGEGMVALANSRGETETFRFETFFNGYDALTLGVAEL